MSRNYYISGEHNVTCDVCSKKIKSGIARKRWDGFIVCPEDYETRHPQDFVRARLDKITVPFSRPRPTDKFIYTQGINDSVFLLDDDDSVDYISPLTSYFNADYLQDDKALQITVSWNRTIADTTSCDDTTNIQVNKHCVDAVPLNDVLSINKITHKILTDSITTTDTGFVFFNDYIDTTYFVSQYVGTSYTF